MEERHLNLKKVCGAVLVFIMAFGIIVGSALITRNAKNNSKIIDVESKQIAQENSDVTEKEEKPQKIEKQEISEEENVSVEQGVKSEFLLPLHTKDNILNGLLPKYNPDSVQILLFHCQV